MDLNPWSHLRQRSSGPTTFGVISISMQFKSGGQPLKGADNPFPEVDFPPTVSYDAVANILFAYGCREGIPRVLDL
jgi:hypothetical protein